VQTSLGPYGRNKIVINHLAKMILTSDAATILRELDVVHPAAKLLVMASQQQEAEMGDATNMVIIFAGELLKKAEELIRMGLKTSDIVSGYEKAQNYALKCLEGGERLDAHRKVKADLDIQSSKSTELKTSEIRRNLARPCAQSSHPNSLAPKTSFLLSSPKPSSQYCQKILHSLMLTTSEW
jgi:T-complex protein 1 subunit theta